MSDDRESLPIAGPTGGLPSFPKAPMHEATAPPTVAFRQVAPYRRLSAEQMHANFEAAPPTHSYGSAAQFSHLPAKEAHSLLELISRSEKLNHVRATRKHRRSSQRGSEKAASLGNSRTRTGTFSSHSGKMSQNKSRYTVRTETSKVAGHAWQCPDESTAAKAELHAPSHFLSADKQLNLRIPRGQTQRAEALAPWPLTTLGLAHLDEKEGTEQHGQHTTGNLSHLKTLSPQLQPGTMFIDTLHSPQKTHVVVVPMLRDSSHAAPQAVYDLPDIRKENLIFPPAASARNQWQEVHLFVSPTASPPLQQRAALAPKRNGENPSPLLSIPTESRSEQERLPQKGRLTLVQVWAICGVAFGTLTIPLGMLLLSYLVTPGGGRNGTPLSSLATKHGGAPLFTLPTWPTWTIVDPRALVPALCRRTTSIVDDVQQVIPQHSENFGNKSSRNFFCLYNNSRYLRGGTHDFLPSNLPLPFCQFIVYWSIGVQYGIPKSRAENFDNMYGLKVLKDTIRSKNATSGILVAVGGYREDNPQFSLLSKDSRSLSRFVGGMMQLVFSYGLDGIAVHWVPAEPGCEGGDDAGTLLTILTNLRRTFALNAFRGLITAIVPADRSAGYPLVASVINVVDYIFLETNAINPLPPLDYNVCWQLASAISTLVRGAPDYVGNEYKICTTLSVAPWRAETNTFPTSRGPPPDLQLSNESKYGGPPGKGSIFDMCYSSPCWLSNTDMCVVIRGQQARQFMPAVYFFHSGKTFREIFEHGVQNSSANYCALVLDLDLDNYSRHCASMKHFSFLAHLDLSIKGSPSLGRGTMSLSKC